MYITLAMYYYVTHKIIAKFKDEGPSKKNVTLKNEHSVTLFNS